MEGCCLDGGSAGWMEEVLVGWRGVGWIEGVLVGWRRRWLDAGSAGWIEECWLDAGVLDGRVCMDSNWLDVGTLLGWSNGCMTGGGGALRRRSDLHTSMAWVYCSRRPSILEMGRAGWDFFTLLLEDRRRVMVHSLSLSFRAHRCTLSGTQISTFRGPLFGPPLGKATPSPGRSQTYLF